MPDVTVAIHTWYITRESEYYAVITADTRDRYPEFVQNARVRTF
jgi:hypothetical protein